MKIGIMTFHWATNYGAVLQAYALQEYLTQLKNDVEIIDYVPFTQRKGLMKCFVSRNFLTVKKKLKGYLKEVKIRKFRIEHLKLSTHKYSSNAELCSNPPQYDAYICGSDQIWNPYFTLYGEKKETFSYFLNFAPEGKIRIAYAASFGCEVYSEDLMNLTRPILKTFDAISVREKSGLNILEELGIEDGSLVADPTLLLNVQDYEKLLNKTNIKSQRLFSYILHDEQNEAKKVKIYIKRCIGSDECNDAGQNDSLSVEDWICSIKNSDIVLTNSYHGMMFSILFHTRFIIMPVSGSLSSMNDRIKTVLSYYGLEERYLEIYDEKQIECLLNANIDWKSVEHRRAEMCEVSKEYLMKSLNL